MTSSAGKSRTFTSSISSLIKHKEYGTDDKSKRHDIVPPELFAKICHRKHRKHDQRDDFLDRLQLRCGKMVGAYPVRRYLKTVLQKGNHPADNDRHPQRGFFEPQVSIPSESHENIRDSKQQYCSHLIYRPRRFSFACSCSQRRMPSDGVTIMPG